MAVLRNERSGKGTPTAQQGRPLLHGDDAKKQQQLSAARDVS
jgi:hypothetical protein